MQQWPKDIWEFGAAIARHWITLITGGTITAGLAVWQGLSQTQIAVKPWKYTLVLFLVMACFQAWADQRRKTEVLAEQHKKDAEKLSSDCMEARQKLEGRIKELELQADNKARRKVLEGKLGAYHRRLASRVDEISDMSYLAFTHKHEASFKANEFDDETQTLVEEIMEFLQKEIGGAAVAIFIDDTTIPKIPTTQFPAFQENGKYWLRVINQTKHYARQLMHIIQTKLDDL